ncbi:MAG: hypothetical protein HUK22_03755, partial [Thermoguttaceae bacterium]|nr:hypothetical protein [Thermoguttaceae bacterium]
VMLYDDGMYPSGSSAGQVVAEDPDFAARGFIRVELKDGETPETARAARGDDGKKWNFVAEVPGPGGKRLAVFDAPSGGVIRGLHYVGDESKPRETAPPAADLLNPDAVDAFIRLVYQKYYDNFAEFFQSGTVVGIFTDEPSILGRGPRKEMKNGNLRSLPTINKFLGYDFTPYLGSLWGDVDADSPRRRAEYARAVADALEEVYYGRISRWCVEHKTALAGHPEKSSDVGVLRKFQIPGQDVVWRYIEPGEKAFDPTHSMMAKVASSAAVHNGARRNLNEVFGAFGHDFTYREMEWLVGWCVVRGHNTLLPHAFYYSIRGPRFDERPPDVGPNAPWWDDYRVFAQYCARLCWLNTDSTLVAPTALLVDAESASARGTRALFENQLDFNYLDFATLTEAADVDDRGVRVKTATYKTLVLTPDADVPENALPILRRLAEAGRLVRYAREAELPGAVDASSDAALVDAVRKISGPDVVADPPAPGLRARHVVKGGVDFYLLFNEIDEPLETTLTFAAEGKEEFWDPKTGEIAPKEPGAVVKFAPFEMKIVALTK